MLSGVSSSIRSCASNVTMAAHPAQGSTVSGRQPEGAGGWVSVVVFHYDRRKVRRTQENYPGNKCTGFHFVYVMKVSIIRSQ